jgi:transposase
LVTTEKDLDIFTTRSKEELADLEADILVNGITDPVIRNQDGVTLSGHNREAIAKKHGLQVPTKVVPTKAPYEDLEQAIRRNPNRPVRGDARDKVVNRLREEAKWADGKIAEMLGLDPETIRRIPKQGEIRPTPANAGVGLSDGKGQQAKKPSAPRKTTGRDAKSRPGEQPKPAELQRRRRMVKKLWEEGYSRDGICEALFIEKGTLTRDLKALDIDTKTTRRKPKTDTPPPQDWHNKPEQEKQKSTPLYKNAAVVARMREWVTAYKRDDYDGRLARFVIDARHAKDQGWVESTSTLANEVADKAERLARIVDEPDFCETCAREEKALKLVRNAN